MYVYNDDYFAVDIRCQFLTEYVYTYIHIYFFVSQEAILISLSALRPKLTNAHIAPS